MVRAAEVRGQGRENSDERDTANRTLKSVVTFNNLVSSVILKTRKAKSKHYLLLTGNFMPMFKLSASDTPENLV